MAERPGEFALIEQFLKPLAKTCPGALSLADDAAVLQTSPDQDLVVTKDALVAGVHFLEREDPGVVAARALRVNLSDLAAMGASPKAYFMALALPQAIDADWLAAFTAQLASDQDTYDIALAGGDTVATPGPLIVSITAVGTVPTGQALTRKGANVGDRLFVSGMIGDAGYGLAILKGEVPDATEAQARAAIARHRYPEPRLALGEGLRGVASAAVDISDGLIADLHHICASSGVGAEIRTATIPTSAALLAQIDVDPAWRMTALSAGDDYELLFAVPPGRTTEATAAASIAGVEVTEIGMITESKDIVVLSPENEPLPIGKGGYVHF